LLRWVFRRSGVIGYFCKIRSDHTWRLWKHLNDRLLKWVKLELGLYKKAVVRWLRTKYKKNPNLFFLWKIAHL
jgi:RNA-directed DNA polymerase